MSTAQDPPTDASRGARPPSGGGPAYTDEVRAEHVGRRVTIRHRVADDRHPLTDVVGDLAAADDATFTVRRRSGELVEVSRPDVVASKLLPPAPARRRPRRT